MEEFIKNEVELEADEELDAGIFLDMPGAYHIMRCHLAMEGKEIADTGHSAKRVASSPISLDNLASYRVERPYLLFSKSTKPKDNQLVDVKQGFGANMSTYEDFASHDHCFRHVLTAMRAELENTMSVHLDTTRPQGRLAQYCLSQALDQMRSIEDFGDRYYRNLAHVCNFNPSLAWKVVGRVLSGIFIHVHLTIRSECKGYYSITGTKAQAKFIWNVMRSINCINAMKRETYHTHQVVLKEIQLFTMEQRVDKDDLKTVKDQLAKLTASLKTATDSVAASEKKMNELKQTVGNLTTRLQKLEKAKS